MSQEAVPPTASPVGCPGQPHFHAGTSTVAELFFFLPKKLISLKLFFDQKPQGKHNNI